MAEKGCKKKISRCRDKESLGRCNKAEEGHVYCISGTKVTFPVKAYPTQITMMHKVRGCYLHLFLENNYILL